MKRSLLPRAAVPAAAAVAIALVGASARAAVIIWQTPTAESTASDVSTTGTLVSAFALGNTGSSDVSVNSVSFVPSGQVSYHTSLTLPGTTDTISATPSGADLSNNGGNSPGLSGSYNTLLSNRVYNSNSTSALVLTLNSLTVGHNYLFQTWVNDSRPGVNALKLTVADGNGNSAILAANTNGTAGTPGQYVIGTFTADATGSQVIDYKYYSGSYSETLANAFQLRDLGSVITPEPATLGLLGLGGLGLLLLGKRRKTA